MTPQQRFEAFHRLNPEVLEGLLELTLKFKAAKGCKYLSSRMIWEYYRATRTLKIVGDGEYKLNNDYLPYYSRLIMTVPGLQGVFRTRRLHTKKAA